MIAIPDGAKEPATGSHIAELCERLKPRYHFSSSEYFYEREPFFYPAMQEEPEGRIITRFISIAEYGNENKYGKENKQKTVYAFTLQPVNPTAPLPAGSTTAPFMRGTKRRALDPDLYSRYSTDRPYSKRGRGGRGQSYRQTPTPDQCFFCLSNPKIGTHLISSIGDDSYLTIAKGPLNTSTTNAGVGIDFPAHALIIPLTHSPTLALIPEEDQKLKTLSEMTKFKVALQNMVADRSNNKLGAVTYEISLVSGVHTHWQFLAIPEELIRKGLVEAAFRVEAENLSYPPFEVRDPGIGSGEGDFFRVWIWTPPSQDDDKESTKCLIMPFDDRIRFSLQFGRTVLAKLLGLEKRIQWRDCETPVEEEKKDVATFKAAFKDFDFTL